MESSSQPTLVLVSGSGRSGTSSLAGSLKRLGLHVPQPEVEPSPNNPRGYYEPAWVIDFHKGYLKELAMHNIDSRPQAVDSVADLVASGEPQRRLVQWLTELRDHPRIVVKDPHAFWFADVWTAACAEAGIDLRWLTALRHPAEVVGSRDLAYLQKHSDELRLVKESSNVAGWVHAALLTEKAGRGARRSFIRYVDLIADWRSALASVADQLVLELNVDLSRSDHHDVDDFLEPSMRKSQLGWDDIRVPATLQQMAEEVWQLLGRLVEDPVDRVAMDRLDEIHDEYRAMYVDAVALTFDHTQGEVKVASREIRQKKQARIRELRQKLRRQEKQLAALKSAGTTEKQARGNRTIGFARRLTRR